jgi:hypothetical protein
VTQGTTQHECLLSTTAKALQLHLELQHSVLIFQQMRL